MKLVETDILRGVLTNETTEVTKLNLSLILIRFYPFERLLIRINEEYEVCGFNIVQCSNQDSLITQCNAWRHFRGGGQRMYQGTMIIVIAKAVDSDSFRDAFRVSIKRYCRK